MSEVYYIPYFTFDKEQDDWLSGVEFGVDFVLEKNGEKNKGYIEYDEEEFPVFYKKFGDTKGFKLQCNECYGEINLNHHKIYGDSVDVSGSDLHTIIKCSCGNEIHI